MFDDSVIDYNFVDDDNITDFYIYASYDHPYWRKQELDLSTWVVPRSTTLAPKPNIVELNKQKCLVFSPLFLILGCIFISGAFCNITVCYIYRCRSRRAASHFFVIFFAVFDLFGCLVGIPLEVASLTSSLMYNVAPLCKLSECVKSWFMCCQCLALLCVAFDCYRKIGHPEREFNVRRAKVCCFVAVILAVVLSLPSLAAFSAQPVRTQYADLFGVGCSFDSNVVQSLRILYYVCVFGTFIASFCSIACLYGLIFATWHKQRQLDETGEKASPVKRDFPKKHRFVRQDTNTSCITQYSEEIYRLHDIHRSLHCVSTPHPDHAHRIRCKMQSEIDNKCKGKMKTSFLSNGNKTNIKSRSATKSEKGRNTANKSIKQSNNVDKSSNQSNSTNKSLNQSNSGSTRNKHSNSGNKSSSLSNSGSQQNYLSSSGINTGNQISGGHMTNHVNQTSGNAHICSGRTRMSSLQLHIKNNRYVLMFTVISVVTTINMLPSAVVTILGATTSMFNSFPSNTSEILFHFCSRSYLFNYLVKPLTYVCLNANFRKETRQICNKLKQLLNHRDVKNVGTSCKKLQRLSVVGPLRSALESTVYRPPRSLS